MESAVQFPTKADSSQFDSVIERLKTTEKKNEHSLLVEHLETAHAYLHGGMPFECTVNLDLAREAAGDVSDRDLRLECKRLIDGMLARLSEPVQKHDSIESHAAVHYCDPSLDHPATSEELNRYFDGKSVRFGTFYPTKHLVGVMESLDLALGGRQRLCQAGIPGSQVIVSSGSEFRRFLEDLRISRSLSGAVATEISRILDTEARLADQYAQWAQQGCGFLFVVSPTEANAWRISGALMELSPIAAHWFAPSSIHRFV